MEAEDIWIRQLDRPPFTLTKLTYESNNANPAWTLDGRAVVYSNGGAAPGLLLRRHADGSGPVDTLLSHRRALTEVAPMRDTAQFVVRFLIPPSRDIALVRRGDTSVTPLAALPSATEVGPALSPDGRWLAYESDESGRFEVYVRPFPNVASGRWQVSQTGGTAPVWAHSGRELFYRNGANAMVAAAVLPGATFTLGGQTVLFDAGQFAGNGFTVYYDVAPDDKRFIFLRAAREAGAASAITLVQITNWAAEVRAKLGGHEPK